MIREADLQATVTKQIEQNIKVQIGSKIRTKLNKVSTKKIEQVNYYLTSDIQLFVNDISHELSIIMASKVQDKQPASTRITGYLIGGRQKMFTEETVTKYVENLLIDLKF